MTTVTRLSGKCKKCKYVNKCDEKRMILCKVAGHINKNPPMMAEMAVPFAASIMEPIAKKHTPITINMGEYGTMNTSLEKLKEQAKKDFYKNLNCAFSEP